MGVFLLVRFPCKHWFREPESPSGVGSGEVGEGPRKVDIRLPEKGNSNSHGARPVYQIISMIEWIRTSRLSMKNTLSGLGSCGRRAARDRCMFCTPYAPTPPHPTHLSLCRFVSLCRSLPLFLSLVSPHSPSRTQSPSLSLSLSVVLSLSLSLARSLPTSRSLSLALSLYLSLSPSISISLSRSRRRWRRGYLFKCRGHARSPRCVRGLIIHPPQYPPQQWPQGYLAQEIDPPLGPP